MRLPGSAAWGAGPDFAGREKGRKGEARRQKKRQVAKARLRLAAVRPGIPRGPALNRLLARRASVLPAIPVWGQPRPGPALIQRRHTHITRRHQRPFRMRAFTTRARSARTMKADNILQTIGRTPHVRINRLFAPPAQVWLKLERANPGGSIKDRIALAMVEEAEKSGALKPGGTIIEPTSGNTGVGLAMVAAVKGYKIILVMPESMSVERRRLMLAYGATFDLTPREKGMKGAIARAEELAAQITASGASAWIPQQFDNLTNTAAHERTTAQEILQDFPEGLDAVITGVGTGGHISAAAHVLKAQWPQLKVFAVEPAASAVISGKAPGPHPLQGIGAGFIPRNLDTAALDGVIAVPNEAALEYGRRCAREEGILVGISTGATLAAIAQKLPELPAGSRVLGFNYDTGERYLSVDGYLPAA